MGKRQIGEIQPTELVITILVSNIATLPLEDMNTPLLTGIVPILSLVCLEVIMSWITLKSKSMRKLVLGSPKIIIKDGVLNQKTLLDLRFSVDDLMTALRGKDIFDIAEVQYAVVETNGKLSVYQRHKYQNVSNDSLDIKGKDMNPPGILISQGDIMDAGLKETGLTANWVKKILQKEKLKAEDIFLFAADKDGKYNIISNENERLSS
jgi:uncharacterized membrane protein YcaP (DUF421 family)